MDSAKIFLVDDKQEGLIPMTRVFFKNQAIGRLRRM